LAGRFPLRSSSPFSIGLGTGSDLPAEPQPSSLRALYLFFTFPGLLTLPTEGVVFFLLQTLLVSQEMAPFSSAVALSLWARLRASIFFPPAPKPAIFSRYAMCPQVAFFCRHLSMLRNTPVTSVFSFFIECGPIMQDTFQRNDLISPHKPSSPPFWSPFSLSPLRWLWGVLPPPPGCFFSHHKNSSFPLLTRCLLPVGLFFFVPWHFILDSKAPPPINPHLVTWRPFPVVFFLWKQNNRSPLCGSLFRRAHLAWLWCRSFYFCPHFSVFFATTDADLFFLMRAKK